MKFFFCSPKLPEDYSKFTCSSANSQISSEHQPQLGEGGLLTALSIPLQLCQIASKAWPMVYFSCSEIRSIEKDQSDN